MTNFSLDGNMILEIANVHQYLSTDHEYCVKKTEVLKTGEKPGKTGEKPGNFENRGKTGEF